MLKCHSNHLLTKRHQIVKHITLNETDLLKKHAGKKNANNPDCKKDT